MKLSLKKYSTLIGSIIVMICIGGVYAWSIFVPALMEEHGLTTTQTQVIFGFMIAFLTISMIFAGKIERKLGPRSTCFIGSVIFALGYLLAWLSEGHFPSLIAGLSLFSGVGIGLCYLSCLVTPVKWFPDKKGLITGISVAGFGLGAIALSNLAQHLFSLEKSVCDVFMIIAVTYGLILLLGTALIIPFKKETEAGSGKKKIDLITSRNFWGLSAGMFAGTFTGLMVIGNLKPMLIWSAMDSKRATLSISLLAIGNMTGRVFWGFLSDTIQGKKIINISLIFLAFSTLALIFTRVNTSVFMVNTFAIGMGFGANFVLFAKEVSNKYGVDKMGLVYPYIFLFYGIAGITGPSIGGAIYDVSNSYNVSILVAGTVCIIGLLIYNSLIGKQGSVPDQSTQYSLSLQQSKRE